MRDTSKATARLFPRNVVIVGGENDHSFRCVGRWIVVPEEDFQAAVERDKLARELVALVNVLRGHLEESGEYRICRADKEQMGLPDQMTVGQVLCDIEDKTREVEAALKIVPQS
jgi:hypothetical protein